MDPNLGNASQQSTTAGPSSRSRTFLWCVPRSGSTALTKCLSAIDGIEAWFEPYTYCHQAEVGYKHDTGTDLPTEYEGKEEAYARAKLVIDTITHANTYPERLAYATVKQDLENSRSNSVFVKDIGFSIAEDRRQFLPRGYKHTFLIRNPILVTRSYRTSIFLSMSRMGILQGEAADESTFDVERDDIYWPPGGFMKELYDLWMYVKENIDSDPVVIDTDDLLTKPKETLSRYCALVGLPFHHGLLQWDASVEGFDKVRACGDDLLEKMIHFYGEAMRSTCFFPPREFPLRDQLTPDVIRCSEKNMTYFNEMYATRIKV